MWAAVSLSMALSKVFESGCTCNRTVRHFCRQHCDHPVLHGTEHDIDIPESTKQHLLGMGRIDPPPVATLSHPLAASQKIAILCCTPLCLKKSANIFFFRLLPKIADTTSLR